VFLIIIFKEIAAKHIC